MDYFSCLFVLSTVPFQFYAFHHLCKRDVISPEYARRRDARSAQKVELGFGRTLKLEQIFTYSIIWILGCLDVAHLAKIDGDTTVRLTERSVRSQV